MKTIGLLGGMSWESTAFYYRKINELVKQKLGGLHSARIAMVSVDFREIGNLQRENKWDEAGELLSKAALQVEAAGADFLLICTNTMHKVAPTIEKAISIPLLHIADATADEIKKHGITRVGLLGTNFTMEQGFYRDRLKGNHGLEVLVPEEKDRALIHRIIFDELVLGIVNEQSRAEYLRIMNDLKNMGAEGIIEGCTEIGMLVQQEHTIIPLFDTAAIHSERAVEVALLQSRAA
ncbi:MAG: aspartate/glutamate racemase family protein [Bacteroidota bacterium]